MAPPKKTGPGNASGTPQKSQSNALLETPPNPPRARVMCPGCSTELTLHKTLSTAEAFIYASKTDMKMLGIECKNDSCPLYIEGIENVDYNLPVNPIVANCVETAKKDRAAIKAANKEKKNEDKKRKREEENAAYANYDPFSGSRGKEAEEAIHRAKRHKKESDKISKAWEKIQKAAAKLNTIESEGPIAKY